jgi:solute carrier family 35 protein E1
MDESSPHPTNANGTVKFPAFSPDYLPRLSTENYKKDDLSLSHENSPVRESSQWMPRRHSSRGTRWTGSNGPSPAYSTRHKRQKSLGEAFHNIRTRSGSVSQNAMEIAEALKAPVSPALVVS